MPDYAGPLPRLVLSRTLWLVVAWPIVGFLWQALVARPGIARAIGPIPTKRALASARNAAIVCLVLAAASTLAHAVVLASAPEGASALFEPLARGARFGQLDAEMDLFFDPLSAVFCALACLVALGASVVLATRPVAGPGWPAWAWIHLSLAGTLVAFAADGFIGIAVGWAMAAAAAAWLAGWNDPLAGIVSAMRSGVAIPAMFLGAALLFWGLGGSWDGDDYAADPLPRFAALHVGGWAAGGVASDPDVASGARSGSGSLTFTSTPGAVVFVDDARTPLGQSPFVGVPVRSGTHTLRIHSGDGSNDEVLARVAVEDGDEIALVPLGPTLTFRAIADQLSVRHRADNTPVRTALEAGGKSGGWAVVPTSLIAFLIAAAFMNGAGRPGTDLAGPRLGLAAVAHGATTAALGPYLIARLAFLFPLAQGTWLAVEGVGAAILLMAGWRAPTSSGIRRWLAFVGAAPAALAYLALGAGGVVVGTAVFVLFGTATAALYLSAARARRLPERSGGSATTVDGVVLVRVPEILGALLVSMDRWVVSAIAGTIGSLARIGAWVAARADERVVGAPATVVATRLVRVGRRVEPAIGVPLGRVTWALLATLAAAAPTHALWPGN